MNAILERNKQIGYEDLFL